MVLPCATDEVPYVLFPGHRQSDPRRGGAFHRATDEAVFVDGWQLAFDGIDEDDHDAVEAEVSASKGGAGLIQYQPERYGSAIDVRIQAGSYKSTKVEPGTWRDALQIETDPQAL